MAVWGEEGGGGLSRVVSRLSNISTARKRRPNWYGKESDQYMQRTQSAPRRAPRGWATVTPCWNNIAVCLCCVVAWLGWRLCPAHLPARHGALATTLASQVVPDPRPGDTPSPTTRHLLFTYRDPSGPSLPSSVTTSGLPSAGSRGTSPSSTGASGDRQTAGSVRGVWLAIAVVSPACNA